MRNAGKAFRLRRLSPPGDGRYLFVPLDHSVSDGPVVPQHRWDGLVRALAAGGADAVVVHKGRARALDPALLGQCAVIVHLSAGTSLAADADAKVLVGDVEDAVRLGADAVSVHVNIGSHTEQRQLSDLGVVASSCETWHMPLLVMIYPRGPRIADPHDPALLAHLVNIAADLGADLVKTSVTRSPGQMAEVVASSPIPVLAAGGPSDGSDLAEYGAALMAAGCQGLAVGRRVFTAAEPAQAVAQLANVVHPAVLAAGTSYPTVRSGAA
ncbi:2-amino-3,7-dideoxy-D-threo-hept-6-ulosonate synthase [Amycolatopsis jejuensis]|uniref:2-amino-3,7-dideoxy-D-threo-hept-6-ulosonate synthase n=1 Tax=Amycolatopsis jejuensis TaxID=330084 RepID=UPI000A006485|nr:2-amino-3,7-dideoxy-D-threo-hept-6-ulosonate synthase [Amycolatopsis jejuensis]